jgi:hypothetical protein
MATETKAREERAAEINKALAHAIGTEGYTRWSALFRRHVLTDGALMLAEMAEAHWLMDAIASYHSEVMKDPMLQDIQFWTFKVNPEEMTGTLICERDTDDVVITQEFHYTDFPLDEIKLYVSPMYDPDGHMVIMLPSER